MYLHKIETSKLNFMREKVELIEDALKEQEGSVALDAARSFLATLDRWEEQDGIIPAEITKATWTMETVIDNAPEVSSMAAEISSILLIEEHEANHAATPEGVPVRDLNPEDYGVIFTTYQPKEELV